MHGCYNKGELPVSFNEEREKQLSDHPTLKRNGSTSSIVRVRMDVSFNNLSAPSSKTSLKTEMCKTLISAQDAETNVTFLLPPSLPPFVSFWRSSSSWCPSPPYPRTYPPTPTNERPRPCFVFYQRPPLTSCKRSDPCHVRLNTCQTPLFLVMSRPSPFFFSTYIKQYTKMKHVMI